MELMEYEAKISGLEDELHEVSDELETVLARVTVVIDMVLSGCTHTDKANCPDCNLIIDILQGRRVDLVS